jgi:hypothetical protein
MRPYSTYLKILACSSNHGTAAGCGRNPMGKIVSSDHARFCKICRNSESGSCRGPFGIEHGLPLPERNEGCAKTEQSMEAFYIQYPESCGDHWSKNFRYRVLCVGSAFGPLRLRGRCEEEVVTQSVTPMCSPNAWHPKGQKEDDAA